MNLTVRYYDRQGNPMTREEWVARFDDWEYRVVARTQVGDITVSTVWLGLDHQPRKGAPIHVFETMAFGPNNDSMTDTEQRYSTEEQALAGHVAVVARVKAAKKEGSDG